MMTEEQLVALICERARQLYEKELRQEISIGRRIVSDTAKNVAISLYKRGHNPSYSSDIEGNTTCGYGKVSEYGFWEFPLPEEYWKSEYEN